jgi:peptidyl-prolyl cis-trans isomerase D
MAIIGKIREKSGLTIVLLGLSMLAFIMGGWDSIFGKSSGVLGLGTVGGEQVDPMKYDNMVKAVMQQDAQQYQQMNRPYTPQDQAISADRAWTMLVENTILEKEYDKLGLDVSKSEFDAYLYGTDGFTVMPDLAQTFIDSITGQFNPRLLEKRITEMESSSDANVSAQWKNTKTAFTDQRKSEKYFQLLSQGVYVTKLEAEENYKAQKEVKNISFVVKRYSEVSDDKIKITDEELKAYYDAHKNEKKYEVTAGRDLKIFDITIAPSKKDTADFSKKINLLKSQFASAKNDSIFVLSNSDLKFYTSTRQSTLRPETDQRASQGLTYPMAMDTIFKMAVPGQVVGPYVDNGKYRLAKVRGFNTNLCKVRHILIGAPKEDSLKVKASQRKADSLVKMITKDNFAEYVTKFSDDGGSKSTGGVIENFLDFEMVPEFSKFAVEKPIGAIGTVKTQFGIHIIEVMERKAIKYPIVSFIEKSLTPSEETESMINEEAYNMLYMLDEKISRKSSVEAKLDAFDTLAQKKGYLVRPYRISEENPKIQGVKTPFAEDKLIKLAYDEDTEIGTLCSAPIEDNDRYIIAMVSSIREKGTPEFIDVKESMRVELMKEKKAAILIQQMAKTKDLNLLAKKQGTTVNKAEVVFANPQIQNAGFEPEIVGTLFSGLRDGEKTIPLKGDQGVYVIQINKTIKAPATNDYSVDQTQLVNSQRANLNSEIKTALFKMNEVKDTRKFSSLGIKR